MHSTYDCLVLFSGGLDSLLACKVLQDQGLRPLGVHFVSPFFGRPERLIAWREMYGLDLQAADISDDFVRLVTQGPRWGWGKHLNPCVDCKILMLQKAKAMLPQFQAAFLATGEVLGQRPMSQRRDALNIILREAGVQDLLIRPLSGKLLPPTRVEEQGRVDRDQLLDIKGRGRKEQLRLAQEYGFPEVPTPAGGCLLTDPEYVKRFRPLLEHLSPPRTWDFHLATVGRQYWADGYWLVIGRNKADNEGLADMVQADDLVFKLASIPGPLALGRQTTGPWPENVVRDAARCMARFSSRATGGQGKVTVRVGTSAAEVREIEVNPQETPRLQWAEPE
ncbi:MAG: tRNA(5-methylaminomethyl-2-thiouridylate) methyltransferase [Desulfovermiculus sp.]|nr:tRNA(5-methylaminomethyl-2-thiouridylate) methyltransferase [Desulfovermiculus sp.]